MKHYPHHIGDYRRDTAHLSNEEDLAYRRLLEMYYDSELPIPLDTKATARKIRLTVDSVNTVLLEFFVKKKDGFHNRRCDLELLKYKGFVEWGRQGGAKRWAKGGHTPPIGTLSPLDTNQNQNQNQNQNRKPDTGKPAAIAASDPVKREIWETGKALLGKDSASLLGKLCKEYGQILVLQAVKDCVAQTPAEPKAWLVARCQERRSQSGNKSAAIERRNHEAVEEALREVNRA